METKLPENLRFNGPTRETPLVCLILRISGKTGSGITTLSRSAIHALCLREYDLLACVHADFLTCPAHLTFSLTVEKWTNLVEAHWRRD